jgi:SpoIIAA-like
VIEVLPESSGKVVGLKISGKLMHDDYHTFVPLLEQHIKDYGTVRVLVIFHDFVGLEARALWDEMKFDTNHCRDVERCAIVGETAWEAWSTKLAKPLFPKGMINYFDSDRLADAWQWIQQ